MGSDKPRSPFAGVADLSARKPVRVLSPDEIHQMLASHQLYLETEYHEGLRANFSSADLTRRDFSGLNLRGVKMDRALLRKADFTGAGLQSANLIGAIMQEARFDRADLSRARLSGGNLVSASLENACLARAEMEFAVMANAVLRGACLCEAERGSARWCRADPGQSAQGEPAWCWTSRCQPRRGRPSWRTVGWRLPRSGLTARLRSARLVFAFGRAGRCRFVRCQSGGRGRPDAGSNRSGASQYGDEAARWFDRGRRWRTMNMSRCSDREQQRGMRGGWTGMNCRICPAPVCAGWI
jgi:hypothetical protein